MLAKDHVDYLKEKKHLEKTFDWIDKRNDFLKSYEENLKKEIIDIKKTITHLMDERLIAKQYLHNTTSKDIEKIENAKNSPYFGRIDFEENKREDVETIYIGKYGLNDNEKEIPIVVDWRAPVANIYYSGHTKDVSYNSPVGEIEGRLYLKRRYEINKGELIEIYDEKSSENIIEDSLKGKEEFLVQALNKTTQGRLKEIVATIQDQQNKIIRSEMYNPLVVQGVAGSGKTTIALHRMAYLIYNNRKNTNAEYMVVAPNKLFLNYIADILPDLGIDTVYQTTFEDLAIKLIGKNVNINQSIDKLNMLMNEKNEESLLMCIISKIKGSLILKKVIDYKVKHLEKELLPNEDLMVDDISLFTYKDIQKVFLRSNVHLSLENRVEKLSEYLKYKLKTQIKDNEDKINYIYTQKINTLKENAIDIELIRKDIIKLYDERDEKIKYINRNISLIVNKYIKKIKKLNTFNFYKSLFEDENIMKKAFLNKFGEERFFNIFSNIKNALEKKTYENEDLGPLAYIHIKLFGINEKNRYTHIVVDEAQDLDELKISVLREVSLNDSFTFVGDLSQGIYSYRGINSWAKTMERVFQGKSYNYNLLTTSYRSTIEIVNLANEIIRKCTDIESVLAEPIFRHGEKPLIRKCCNDKNKLNYVIKDIRKLLEEGMSSIAIICKDLNSTKQVYELLKNKFEDINLITDEVTDFKSNLVVVPSYLSKGLEFDAVLIWDVGIKSYSMDSIDIKLMYISVTRVLHKLFMYYNNNLNEALINLEGDKYIEFKCHR